MWFPRKLAYRVGTNGSAGQPLQGFTTSTLYCIAISTTFHVCHSILICLCLQIQYITSSLGGVVPLCCESESRPRAAVLGVGLRRPRPVGDKERRCHFGPYRSGTGTNYRRPSRSNSSSTSSNYLSTKVAAAASGRHPLARSASVVLVVDSCIDSRLAATAKMKSGEIQPARPAYHLRRRFLLPQCSRR